MFTELSFEERILGGSVEDALHDIRRIKTISELMSLLSHEEHHMQRKTVFKALKARIHKLERSTHKVS